MILWILLSGYVTGLVGFVGGAFFTRDDTQFFSTGNILLAGVVWPLTVIVVGVKWLIDEFLEGIRP